MISDRLLEALDIEGAKFPVSRRASPHMCRRRGLRRWRQALAERLGFCLAVTGQPCECTHAQRAVPARQRIGLQTPRGISSLGPHRQAVGRSSRLPCARGRAGHAAPEHEHLLLDRTDFSIPMIRSSGLGNTTGSIKCF